MVPYRLLVRLASYFLMSKSHFFSHSFLLLRRKHPIVWGKRLPTKHFWWLVSTAPPGCHPNQHQPLINLFNLFTESLDLFYLVLKRVASYLHSPRRDTVRSRNTMFACFCFILFQHLYKVLWTTFVCWL